MAEKDPEDVPVDSVKRRMPSAEEIHLRKKRRTSLRRQITIACKQIIAAINDRGSPGALKGLMAHLKRIRHEITIIHTDFLTVETDDEEVDAQEETHFTYMKAIGVSKRQNYTCILGRMKRNP
jgi:hypothetical protein